MTDFHDNIDKNTLQNLETSFPSEKIENLNVLEEATQNVSDTIQETIDLGAEDVMANLVLDGEIENSVYLDHVVNFFNFLGKKLKICIQIGQEKMFPENEGNHILHLETSTINSFTKKAGMVLSALAFTGTVSAQSFEGGEDSHSFTNWPLIIGALVMLGVSTFAARKLIKKYKKNSSDNNAPEDDEDFSDMKPPEEAAEDYFDDYEKAKEEGDEEAQEKAKEQIIDTTQGEINDDLTDIKDEDIDDISKQELKEALALKKEIDDLIASEMAAANEKIQLLNEDPTSGEVLKKINNKMSATIEKAIKVLLQKHNKLSDKLSVVSQEYSQNYFKKQLQVEMKKLEYTIDYFKLLKKKWMIQFEELKKGLENGEKNKADENHEIKKDILDLQQELNELLEKQNAMTPEDFEEELKEIEKKLEDKIQNAKDHKVPEYDTSEEEEVGFDKIIFENNGKYEYPNPVTYTIQKMNGETQSVSIPLTQENSVVQLWVNDQKKIKFNFSEKYFDNKNTEKLNIIDSQNLIIGNDDLVVKKADTPLAQHLKDLQSIEHDTPEVELPAESAETLQSIAEKIKLEQQKTTSIRETGEHVELDNDAIEFQRAKIHREYHDGKEHAVVKFILNENYWKSALENLKKYNDIPKQSISFNYEGPGGKIKYSGQPAVRFNIIKKGSSIPVIIPSTNDVRGLQGEVRILFPKEIKMSSEEMQEIIAEVANRLGIQNHMIPVTDEAREQHIEKMKDRRRGNPNISGEYDVNSEYSTERIAKEHIEKMKEEGLSCIYAQCSSSSINAIFKTGNLFSTSTRYSKGIFIDGMSSSTDLNNGGGKSVFTRMHTKNSQKAGDWYNHTSKPAIIFSPNLLERIDCYAYPSDKFGSLSPSTFDNRMSPENLLKKLNASYNCSNEIMFQDAIPVTEAQYIVCDNPQHYIKELKTLGVSEIGGKPLEKAVITPEKFKSLSNI